MRLFIAVFNMVVRYASDCNREGIFSLYQRLHGKKRALRGKGSDSRRGWHCQKAGAEDKVQRCFAVGFSPPLGREPLGGVGLLAIPVIVFTSIFSAAFTMVSARGMLCRVRDEGRVAYTGLWILGISAANGLPPILAGLLIGLLGMAGFQLCFCIAGGIGLAAAGLMFGLSPEEGKPPMHELHHLIRPAQPLRSLGRVFWVTLGFGEKKERGRHCKKPESGQHEDPRYTRA